MRLRPKKNLTALWEFVEKEKPSWDVVSLCPPLIIGPMLHEPLTASKLNASNEYLRNVAFKMPIDQAARSQMAVIDVRDAAHAHRLAFESPQAANERFLIFSCQWVAQDWCMSLSLPFPSISPKVR